MVRLTPHGEPYWAWANFEFLLDGRIGEVDLLLVAPKGVFLMEVKSWPGVLEGDAGTWQLTRPGLTTNTCATCGSTIRAISHALAVTSSTTRSSR
jgi:Nuclease-related domain